MGSTLEITIQRRVDGSWPVVVEHHRLGTLLPVRSEGRLRLAGEPTDSTPRSYGTTLGQALFRCTVRDAFVRARNEGPDGVRVLVFVESEELKTWRWEWLCGPVDSGVWDFLSLDQRVLFSLYLPSLIDRAYPPIGRHDLRALVVVASPIDPKYSRLASFDVRENVRRLQSIFGEQLPAAILARVSEAVGAPTLDEIVRQLTAGAKDGPYTILHLVCHGWVNSDKELNPEKETTLYLEQPNAEPASGRGLVQAVNGSDLIERLRRVARLPYLIFLSTCESAAPEAEQRMGGLAQRLVRELGIPAVIGMTERVSIATAHALADEFYRRLLVQAKVGEVDRALVQAYAGLATRTDVNVPALYSRLGAQPLFSLALDRQLTAAEIRSALEELEKLLVERAPVLQSRLAEKAQKLDPLLGTDPEALTAPARQERETALTEINELCQEAVEINFNALAQGEPPPAYDSRQPFRGLYPFRAEDREFFFGREAVVQKLYRKLNEDHFLPVLGPSGSGKSSLVLAGLVPKLKEEVAGLQVIDDLTPGSAPMEQLKIRQAKLSAGPVLYIVDQFEELFTLCKEEKQRQDFIEELMRLADGNRVLLTMRADFWGECASYPVLKERMQARQELIAPMTASELRGAMEQQAAKVGLRFEADLSNTMLDEVAGEPGAMPLLQHALLELWKRRHGRWLKADEYRTIGGVKKAIAETADQVYNQLGQEDRNTLNPTPLADQPTPMQERMRDVFVRLTQLDEQVGPDEERRDTRRRVPFAELVPTGSDPDLTKRLVKRFADAVLVTTSHNPRTEQDEVEVAHEALIRHWAMLRAWLNNHRERLELRQSIAEAAMDWAKRQSDSSLLVHRGARLEQAEGIRADLKLTNTEARYLAACRALRNDELEQARATAAKLRRRAALLGLLLVLAVASGLLASVLWRTAERQGREARSREVAASAVSLLISDPELSLLLSAEAVRIDPTSQAETALRQALFLSRVRALTRWDADNEWDPAGRPRNQSFFDASGLRIVTTTANSVRVWSARDGRTISELKGHTGRVNRAVFSRDGRFVVTASIDRTVRTWDASTGAQLRQFVGHSGKVETAQFSQDGTMIVSAGQDAVRVWNVETGVLLATFEDTTRRQSSPGGILDLFRAPKTRQPKPIVFEQREEMEDATFSPDGRLLATLNRAGIAKVYRVGDWKVLNAFDGHHTFGYALTFSPDSQQIVTSGADNTAKLWDVASGRLLLTLTHADAVTNVAISPDGRSIATGSQDRTARVWDRTTGSLLAELRGHSDILTDLSFSVDSQFAITASADGTARVWDARRGAEILLISGHRGAVTSARFSPDGKSIVTASGDILSKSGSLFYTVRGDKTSRLWDVSTNSLVAEASAAGIYKLVPSPSAHRFATVFSSGVRVWDAETLKPLTDELSASPEDLDAAFSPDETLVAVWFKDPASRPTAIRQTLNPKGPLDAASLADEFDPKRMKVSVFEIATGARLLEVDSIPYSITPASFSPDSASLALGDPAGGIAIYSLRSRRRPARLKMDESRPLAVSFLNDQTVLLLGVNRGGSVWNLTQERKLTMFPMSTNRRDAKVVFSRDTKRFALTNGTDFEVRASERGDLLLTGKGNQISDMAFDPIGESFLTGDHDGKLRVWDLTSRRQTADFQAHFGNVNTATFDSDGALISTASEDGTVKVWELRSGALIGEVPSDSGSVGTFAKSEVIGTFIDSHRHFIVARRSGKLSVHDCPSCLPVEELQRRAAGRTTRSLTPDERALYLRDAEGH